MATFDEFKKIELKVAEIKAVEDIEGADKLYKLGIDLGDEQRTLVAGIKLHYPEKEALIGKKIAVVSNLEPRALRGVTSHGMLLAASTPDKSAVVLLTLDKDIPNGSTIS
ncbi:MAG TPA: methionine--tRNA ligase subunit beta [Candidatus Omnitrophota bacterium]|nr:methionine--tRNA ligase subunit beta [Candidatus Omnitrophota bacterium]